MKRSASLRKTGKSPVALLKKRIQALLRERVIERDGGCVLRNSPIAGSCGGYRNDGELILQAEHLNGRSHAVSYGDLDNIVCLCKNHHLFFKKREPLLYWTLIEEIVGPKRWEKIQAWVKDKTPHRMYAQDWLDVAESLETQ